MSIDKRVEADRTMRPVRNAVLVACLALYATISGCSSGGSGTSGALSCDIDPAHGGKANDRVCIASTGYGKVAGDSDATKANCTTAGGTFGTACNLTGAVAGCRGSGAGGGTDITFTYWYFTGSVDDVKAKCPSPMVVVLPDQAGMVGASGGGAGAGGSAAGAGGVGPSGVAGSGAAGAGGSAAGAGGAQKSLSGVTALSSGFDLSCAIIAGGKVACWGNGINGALGNVMLTNANSPEARIIPGVEGAIALSAGTDFACAVLQDQTVRCWGSNDAGKLGGGEAVGAKSGYPTTVLGLTGVTAVASGDTFACAIASGAVWCWGSNLWDELGTNGVPTSSAKPMKMPGLTNVTALAAGTQHACALVDGAAWCWGENASLESGGAGLPNKLPTPTQIAGLTGVTALTVGSASSYAILADGTAWCWGYDGCEVNGARSFTKSSAVPVKLPSFSNLAALTVGEGSFCGLLKSGTVQCPTSTAAIAGLANVKAISGGRGFTCALVDAGVRCWGVNAAGQLGGGAVADPLAGGATLSTTTPSPVVGPCCGEDAPTFSSGLSADAKVADLPADQFQSLCQKVRGDTNGLQELCKAYAATTAAAAPKTSTDSELQALCKMTYDSCWPVPATGPYSPTTCSTVATSGKCTAAVAEVEACQTEQSWTAKVNAPLVPDCATLTRAALDAIPYDKLRSPPACPYISATCPQILQSP